MHTESEEETSAHWMKEAQKGYIRVAVLILLSQKPHHGYEIMKEIRDKTKGFWKPTAGGVYPILRNLEKTHYIVGKWSKQRNRRIKVYKITQTGKAILKRAITKQSVLATSMNALFQEFHCNLMVKRRRYDDAHGIDAAEQLSRVLKRPRVQLLRDLACPDRISINDPDQLHIIQG